VTTRAGAGLAVPSGKTREENAVKLSTDHILTTHVGSLPRPQALVDLLVKKDHNEPYDHAEFDRQVTKAVGEIVAHQVARPARSATQPTSRSGSPASVASRIQRSHSAIWRTILSSAIA
jgi:hypothetical protein